VCVCVCVLGSLHKQLKIFLVTKAVSPQKKKLNIYHQCGFNVSTATPLETKTEQNVLQYIIKDIVSPIRKYQ